MKAIIELSNIDEEMSIKELVEYLVERVKRMKIQDFEEKYVVTEDDYLIDLTLGTKEKLISITYDAKKGEYIILTENDFSIDK